MKYFPPQNQNFRYLQTNRSNILGSLWSSFNLDFQTNLGVIRLAQKLETNTTSSDDADLGRPTAFEYFDDRWWAICGTRIFKNTTELLTNTFSEDASTGAVTTYDSDESDLAVFNDRLWASAGSALYSKVSNGSGTGAWTSRDSTGAGIHQMAFFKKFNRLYYVDNNFTISSIDTADVVANTIGQDYFISLLLNNSEEITSIVADSQNIWIGTRCITNSSTALGTRGNIYQWDGISGTWIRKFILKTAGILAMVVDNDIPYVIDTEGRILVYTGSSFEEIARFPIDNILLERATADGSDGNPVHFNGFVATKNNTLLILINNQNDDNPNSITENFPSGIWELDLSTKNLTHRYSATLKSKASSTVTDFGQNRILGVGGLKLNTLPSGSSLGRATLICGFDYFTDASSSKSAIFIDSPKNADSSIEGQKRGYFVTTWFESNEITDKWNRLWATFRRFLNSTDKIILKYRLNEEAPIEATITWVNTTSFTTTTDITAYDPATSPFKGTYGGEVEIIQGTGSGACVHILSIVNNGGTYTVTIDNAVTGVTTGTAKARFQKWIKMLPESTGQVLSYGQMSIGESNIRIQIKCVLEFTGDDEFYKFLLQSEGELNSDQ